MENLQFIYDGNIFLHIFPQRNSLRRATHEMFEAYDDFDDARVDLQEAKLRLGDAKNEVIQVKTGLQNSMVKLERLVNNFQSPRTLNSLNARDRAAFQRDLENVRHDIEEARIRLRDAEGELDDEDTARVMPSNLGPVFNIVKCRTI